ncbi:MAG: CinA family protein [Promethearchaeota archaeon]
MNLENEAKKVLDLLSKKNVILGISESITGGEISAALTKIDGCSKVLFGSQVVYSELSKASYCNMNLDQVRAMGTISKKMVINLNDCLKSRILNVINEERDNLTPALPGYLACLSTCGIAGKSIENKPRGLVFIGLSVWRIIHHDRVRDELISVKVKELNLAGSRDSIIKNAAREALLLIILSKSF